MNIYDIVRLKYDLPEDNLKKGMTGVIIDIFDEPTLGYEVEFTNEKGETIIEIALEANQLEYVKSER